MIRVCLSLEAPSDVTFAEGERPTKVFHEITARVLLCDRFSAHIRYPMPHHNEELNNAKRKLAVDETASRISVRARWRCNTIVMQVETGKDVTRF